MTVKHFHQHESSLTSHALFSLESLPINMKDAFASFEGAICTQATTDCQNLQYNKYNQLMVTYDSQMERSQ
eukprot:3281386-Pleurochrysis_carterae.AAC.1